MTRNYLLAGFLLMGCDVEEPTNDELLDLRLEIDRAMAELDARDAPETEPALATPCSEALEDAIAAHNAGVDDAAELIAELIVLCHS